MDLNKRLIRFMLHQAAAAAFMEPFRFHCVHCLFIHSEVHLHVAADLSKLVVQPVNCCKMVLNVLRLHVAVVIISIILIRASVRNCSSLYTVLYLHEILSENENCS